MYKVNIFYRGETKLNINDIYTDDFEYCTAISSKLNELDKEQLIDIIGQLNETVKTLSRVSKQDAQTKLLHKTATEVKIKDYLSKEGKNGAHALMLIDIDNFKSVNDNNGHIFGDNVICEFAAKLHSICGKNNNIVGRVGGDEFMILVKNSLLSDVIRIANTISCTFRKICIGDICSNVSCSIGISCYPSDSRDFMKLYEYADIALYHSKQLGKNRCSVYSAAYNIKCKNSKLN